MIAVIADDFTGAAEIAGLGWRQGLSAEIVPWLKQFCRAASSSAPDLLVLDSDSRNLSIAAARKRVHALASTLKAQQPEWVFKKVDSVLRGNVLVEIRALQRMLELPRALLVPANPNAGRTIRDGCYYIQGTPIDRTDFCRDPRHPRRSARVLDLLGCGNKLAPGAQLLQRGDLPPYSPAGALLVGEVSTFADVQHWAAQAQGTMLVAGGADFFRALLETRSPSPATHVPGRAGRRSRKVEPALPSGSCLFVCGSLANSSQQFIADRQRVGWPVLPMPKELLRTARSPETPLALWIGQTVQALAGHPRVVISIGGRRVPGSDSPARLGRVLTNVVAQVLVRSRPSALCVEGGATAAQLVARLGWQRLSVAGEFATGVVGLRPAESPELLLVCKPGSYAWPAGFI